MGAFAGTFAGMLVSLLLVFLICVAVMRWAFRINDIVENLEAIRKALSQASAVASGGLEENFIDLYTRVKGGKSEKKKEDELMNRIK